METAGISFIAIILSPIAGFFLQFYWKELRKEIFGILGCLFIHFFFCFSIEDKSSVAYLLSLIYFTYCIFAFWTMDIKEKVLRQVLITITTLPMIVGYLEALIVGCVALGMK